MSRPADLQRDVWVGIDLGTQSVRVLAVTGGGQVVGASRRPLTSHRSGARHEQDPMQWWEAVSAASREALAGVAAERVMGVAVDATSGTILLTDPEGRPLTRGLMYDDGRAAGEVRRVNELGAETWQELGYQKMQPSWALPKLMWLLREGGPLGPGSQLAHQNDFINRQLVGHAVPTDLSNALKTGAHLVREAWPEELFQTLGIPLGMLPPLVRSGTTLGTVSSEAAALTGIPAGTPVVAGATDGCAAQLGSGALEVGSWNSVLGTTLVLKGVSRDLIADPLGVVYSHRAPNGGWLPGGASSTGAGILSRDFPGRDLGSLEKAARLFEPAGVSAYPLAARGERFPFQASGAEGFVLPAPSSDGQHYAAILQGIAFIERLSFDYLDLLGARVDGPLVLTGGGTKSEYWCQLRADIQGRPVTLPQNAEPALGMALLAASPGRDTEAVAAEMVHTRQVIEPRSTRGVFDEPYLALLGELEQRGWLPGHVAKHAIERAAQ